MTSFFSAEGNPILIKFRRLVQNDMSTAVIWSKSKPEVKFQYSGRLGEFNGISSQSYLPHCRVLPPSEFNVMIPEQRVTLQGAAAWWIHCHDSRATYHIVGCCQLANSVACHPWATYHIAGCWHLVNSLSWFESHMPQCGVLPPGEFNDMWSQSHVSLCRVGLLPLGEVSRMIPEPPVLHCRV